jgi:hypothetical protein
VSSGATGRNAQIPFDAERITLAEALGNRKDCVTIRHNRKGSFCSDMSRTPSCATLMSRSQPKCEERFRRSSTASTWEMANLSAGSAISDA